MSTPTGGHWSMQRRQRHSVACKNKVRLTKEQKLAIIHAVEGPQPNGKPISQVGCVPCSTPHHNCGALLAPARTGRMIAVAGLLCPRRHAPRKLLLPSGVVTYPGSAG